VDPDPRRPPRPVKGGAGGAPWVFKTPLVCRQQAIAGAVQRQRGGAEHDTLARTGRAAAGLAHRE